MIGLQGALATRGIDELQAPRPTLTPSLRRRRDWVSTTGDA